MSVTDGAALRCGATRVVPREYATLVPCGTRVFRFLEESLRDFVIRPATKDDLPEMLLLWREMMDFHSAI
jgi:hypothetical protein